LEFINKYAANTRKTVDNYVNNVDKMVIYGACPIIMLNIALINRANIKQNERSPAEGLHEKYLVIESRLSITIKTPKSSFTKILGNMPDLGM
jgi:hypothetical protein